MKGQIIEKLCQPLGCSSAKRFSREFGIGEGTLSDLNKEKAGKGVTILYNLLCDCLEELSKSKAGKVARKNRK